MNRILSLSIILLLSIKCFSQGNSVATAEQFCSGGSELLFPNITGNPDDSSVGCLGSIPNPAYYYLTIDQPGDLVFTISQEDTSGTPIDVDFIAWGPFMSIADADANISLTDCPSCPFSNVPNTGFYPFGNIIDCSYSTAGTETMTINGAVTGQIYVVLITNFDGDAGFISLQQTGGLGTTSCANIPVCGGNFYDSGGDSGNYSNNESNTTTVYPYVAGGTVTVDFTMVDITAGDVLTVYDGPNNSYPSLGNVTTAPVSFTSTDTSGTLTFVFTSNASGAGNGWAADVTCTSPPIPPTCGSIFYDSGGASGNYSNYESTSTTFYPDTPGDAVTVTFTSFNTESGYDELTVYNGPNSTYPVLGVFSGTSIPGPFTSSDSSGALTFVFDSDYIYNYSGWEANITCGSTCDVNITKTLSPFGADDCTLDYATLEATTNTTPVSGNIIYSENFDTNTTPTGWNVVNGGTGTTWVLSNTNDAGGNANEAMLEWNSGFENGTWRLRSGNIPITGETGLQLSFKHYLAHWDSSYPYQINMQIQVDGGTWTPYYSVNPVTNDIGPQTINIDLSSISGNTLRFRFSFIGESFGLLYWAIDDILITGDDTGPTIPSIIWSPITDLYTDTSLTTPYTGGYAGTVYAAPNGTITYTATDDVNSCSDTVDVTRNKKVWQGNTSSDWNDSSNWFPNGVPTSSNCIVIPDMSTTSNDAILSYPGPPIPPQPGYGLNLTVENNGYLELDSDASLTITDRLDVQGNGIFNLKNSANFIQINNVANTGNIYVQRAPNFTYTPVGNLEYVYWSSPVSNFNVAQVSPGSSAGLIWEWDATVPGNGIGNHGDWYNAAGNMALAKGYTIRKLANTPTIITNTLSPAITIPVSANTALFSGVPNNGDITIPIYHGGYNAAGDPGYQGNSSIGTLAYNNDDNWNLLGNPYPSSISANEFVYANSNINGTVYLWQHSSTPAAITDPFYGDYVYNYDEANYIEHNYSGSVPPTNLDPDLYIASGQAFFVLMNHSATSGTSVTFNNGMRNETYSNTVFYRQNNSDQNTNFNAVERHRIWLDLITPNNKANTTLIGYVEGATNGLDRLYDGYEFESASANIYSVLGDEKLSIQGRILPFDDEDTVPLGVVIPNNDIYQIAINTLDGLFENTSQAIFLEDTYTNVIHDLRTSPYAFTSDSGTFNDRFILRYTDNSLSLEDFENAPEITITAPDNNYIKVTSSMSQIENVMVYDLLGRVLINKTDIMDFEYLVCNMNYSNGTYIVKATLSNGQSKTQKVVLKQ